MKVNLPVTQHEVFLDPARPIVTKTDLKGQITYANRAFIDISGFHEDELLGFSHNIVRHPDMPPEAFADLCGIDRSYMGCVERGESNLALVNIEKIVRALNMPLSEFFKFVDASSDAQN